MKFTRSFTLKGQTIQAFDTARKSLSTYGYKEEGVQWPNYVVLKRGSGGLFKTKIEDCKTLLTISLKQHGEDVFVLCEYDIKTVGGVITAGDKAVLENEIERLKSELHGSIQTQNVSEVKVLTEAGPRRCEMCGSHVMETATFCNSCGRAVKPRPISINLTGQDIIKRGIEVKFEPDRVQTGYGNLDLLLHGGFPDGYAVVLTSPSGEERDLLVTRILETGVKNGETTFFVCSEMSKVDHLASKYTTLFYAFVCNPQADLLVINAPNVFKIGAIERLTELNVALSSAINALPKDSVRPRRLVLNNVSDVLLSCRAQITRKWLMELIPRLKAQKFTILTILNPYMHAKEEAQAVIDLFDGYIEIYEKDDQSGMYMRVKKMYNQRYLSKEVPIRKEDLQILPDMGV